MKWDPTSESLDDFSYRFCELATDLDYTDQQQLESFICCIPPSMYIYVVDTTSVTQAIIKLKKCLALGTPLPTTTPKAEETKTPTVPFMYSRDHKSVSFPQDILSSEKIKQNIRKAVSDSVGDIRENVDKMSVAFDRFRRDQDQEREKTYGRDRGQDRGSNRD